MKHTVLASAGIVFILCLRAGATEPIRPLASLFPELEGWRMEEKAETFLPENLYEHINGAAENFLNYDFEQLAVQNYAQGSKSLSAEIYFHGKPENAFGIYSSEKPLKGNYFSVGGQAYAEAGVMNFVSDAYYVKLNAFGLGAQEGSVLSSLAEKIAKAIGGRNALPKILAAFPNAGKIVNSERFILNNFLGHAFLRSAFLADYRVDGRSFQLFIIRTGSEGEARTMLETYAALDKGKPAPAVPQPGMLFIQDPYNGPVQLLWQGEFICGSNSQAPAAVERIVVLARNLAEQ